MWIANELCPCRPRSSAAGVGTDPPSSHSPDTNGPASCSRVPTKWGDDRFLPPWSWAEALRCGRWRSGSGRGCYASLLPRVQDSSSEQVRRRERKSLTSKRCSGSRSGTRKGNDLPGDHLCPQELPGTRARGQPGRHGNGAARPEPRGTCRESPVGGRPTWAPAVPGRGAGGHTRLRTRGWGSVPGEGLRAEAPGGRGEVPVVDRVCLAPPGLRQTGTC